jgi:hypothetical protein
MRKQPPWQVGSGGGELARRLMKMMIDEEGEGEDDDAKTG